MGKLGVSQYNPKIGEVYNYFKVDGEIFTDENGVRKVKCICKCGEIRYPSVRQLCKNEYKSCGCYNLEQCKIRATKHNLSRTKLYKVYHSIKGRCQNPDDQQYLRYGKRGIKICKEWDNNFEIFYQWSMDNGYQEGLTIDRKDNNGDYCPENCRFVTQKINSRNRRSNKLITIFGETKTVVEWSEDSRCVVNYSNFRNRIHLGYNPEIALTKHLFYRGKRRACP